MRMHRIVTALLAFALIVLSPLATSSSSTAQAPDAKPKREITIKGKEPRSNVFYVVGNVKPNYPHGRAKLLKKNCGTCSWYLAKRFRTDGESRYKQRVYWHRGSKRTCFKVRVPGNSRFATSDSGVVCIVVTGRAAGARVLS